MRRGRKVSTRVPRPAIPYNPLTNGGASAGARAGTQMAGGGRVSRPASVCMVCGGMAHVNGLPEAESGFSQDAAMTFGRSNEFSSRALTSSGRP